jgi:hypothetical protein
VVVLVDDRHQMVVVAAFEVGDVFELEVDRMHTHLWGFHLLSTKIEDGVLVPDVVMVVGLDGRLCH